MSSIENKKKTYNSLPIKRKLEIINRVEQLPPNKKKKDIAAEFGIPASTLSTILKSKDALRNHHAVGSSKKMRHKNPTRPDVDAGLYQWFIAARAQSIPISGEILKSKAEELNQEIGCEEWTCSSGWLSRWKVRHNIKYRSVCGENAAVDRQVCDDWKEKTLLPILERYDPNDVYNADETGLYWRLLPDKTHAFSGEICTGGKLSKERITILVCTNMTGYEKLPLLAIGKFKKPRCFRGVTCLQTGYEANKNAWMTSTIFEEWIRKWDEKLKRKERKIALFVDNCSAHPPHISSLDCIELVFLPPNTTSEIQPCDQGIIKTFKTYYRKNMVKALIHAINTGSTLQTFKITLLDALQIARKAWDSVSATAITNCFRKGGFTRPVEDECVSEMVVDKGSEMVPENEDDIAKDLSLIMVEQLGVTSTFEDYVCSDSNVQCVPMLDTTDIVASLVNVEDGDSDDDVGDELPIVTYRHACSAFETVKSFFLRSSQRSNIEPPYDLLSRLNTELVNRNSILCTQTLITDYMYANKT